MSADLGSVIIIFLGIFSRVKSKIKIMELNSQLGIANHKVDLLNKSIDSHEKKAAEISQETEKVDKSNP